MGALDSARPCPPLEATLNAKKKTGQPSVMLDCPASGRFKVLRLSCVQRVLWLRRSLVF